MKFTLKSPLQFEGASYSELDVDFESLTGEDVIACERQLRSEEPGFTYMKESSKVYQAIIVARAAKVPVELVKKLSAPDFSRLTMHAQNFLLGLG